MGECQKPMETPGSATLGQQTALWPGARTYHSAAGEKFGARAYIERRKAARHAPVSRLSLDTRLRKSITEKWAGATRVKRYWLLVGARRGYRRAAQTNRGG